MDNVVQCNFYQEESMLSSFPYFILQYLRFWNIKIQFFKIIPIIFHKQKSRLSVKSNRLIKMRRKNQMRQIQELTQQAQSISLNSQSSVIEQYNQLQFSDEIQRQQNSSSDAELSLDKLKYLGIDRFPGHYAHHLSKIKENSETRQEFSRKQINAIGNSFLQQSKVENGLYSRKKQREKNKQISINQHIQQQKQEYFNIDSFLNSRPMHRKPTQKQRQFDHGHKYVNKSHNIKKNYEQQEDQRTKYNSNQFRRILQQQNETKKQRKSYLLQKQPQFKMKKKERNIYQQRNRKIKQFVDQSIKRQHRILHQQYKDSYQKGSFNQESQQSITLITLPQPKQPQKLPNKGANRHVKSHSLYHNDQQQKTKDDWSQAKMFQIRFQQAKIGFMDSFLPDSMKIGSNPYNFWKYANSKPERYLKMI